MNQLFHHCAMSIFVQTRCELTGKFKGKCPLGVLIYTCVDPRKDQGRAKDVGATSLFLVVKIMMWSQRGWGGDCIDLDEHLNAEFLSTTLIERNSEREVKDAWEHPGAQGKKYFKRLCSTNSTAAGFQEDLCLWDLAIVLVRKLEY